MNDNTINVGLQFKTLPIHIGVRDQIRLLDVCLRCCELACSAIYVRFIELNFITEA